MQIHMSPHDGVMTCVRISGCQFESLHEIT